MAQTTSTFHCPTHGDFSQTTNGTQPPAKTTCPTCGKVSGLVN